MQLGGFGKIAHVDGCGPKPRARQTRRRSSMVKVQVFRLTQSARFPWSAHAWDVRRLLSQYSPRVPIRTSWRPHVSSFISSDGSGGNGTTSPRLADRSIAMVSSRLR